MDIKLIVCQACLSTNRDLYPIRKLQDLIMNVDLGDLNLNFEGGLCWECKRIILKFSTFRKQAELAQSSLHKREKLQSLKSLSTLTCTVSSTYSYPAIPDLLNTENLDNTKPIKQETEDTIDNSDDDYDEKPACELDIDIQENEIKKEVVKKKIKRLDNHKSKVKKLAYSKCKEKTTDRTKNESIDYNNVKDIFVQVKFTEEELMKSREEKRSHPNFKKLPYNCDSCVLGFTRKDYYDVHMEKKHNMNIGRYMCPVCQVRFTSPATLTKHVRKHYHCYQCKLCSFETSELWSAQSHGRSKHKGDTEGCIHCRQCSYVAKCRMAFNCDRDREELAGHTKSAHSLVCAECGEKFKGRDSLKSHMRRVHSTVREHKCDTCPRAFRSRGRLEAHMATHGAVAAARLAYCVLCRVQYKNLYVYRNHLATSANHSERRTVREHKCDTCPRAFRSRGRLEAHMATHGAVAAARLAYCVLCRVQYKNLYVYRNHLATSANHSERRTVREHKCDTCPRAFRSRGRLEAHMATHGAVAAARLAYCVLCRVQYKNLYVYRNHLATSANHSERRHHCKECGKKFASKVYYKRHYAFYHQKESKFKCELCDRLFISDWRLRHHRQVQHGAARARNHACDQCGNKFYTGSTLRAHQLTHSSQRSFMCADCGDTFKQRAALYTHTKLVHRGLKRQPTT